MSASVEKSAEKCNDISSQAKSQPSCRRVQFPESEELLATIVVTVPARTDYDEGELANLFFSRQDYQMSRSQAKVISKESERYGFSKNLEQTWAEKSSDAQDKLNAWAAQGHARRGLERWANGDHGEKRQQDQFQAIMAVLRAQDDMLARKRAIDVEKLRKVSHKSTKIARHFARMMGKADSFAIAQQLREEDPKFMEFFHNSTIANGMNSLANEFAESASVAPSVTTCATQESIAPEVAAVYASIEREYKPAVDEDGLIADFPPAVDEVNSSSRTTSGAAEKLKLRQRFGFGRKNVNNRSTTAQTDKVDDARVSRVA